MSKNNELSIEKGLYPTYEAVHVEQPLSTGPILLQPVLLQNNTPNNNNIARDQGGNALCNTCQTPYPLPNGCTSWRCQTCHTFNNASIYGDECPCCLIS